MADFGEPRYGLSKRGGRIILWNSRVNDQICFKFAHRIGADPSYWYCCECHAKKKTCQRTGEPCGPVRTTQHNKKYPPIRTLEELVDCEQLQTSVDGDPWLLMVDAEELLVIVATGHDLALLHASDHWIADGNFDFQPPMFTQLYTYTASAIRNAKQRSTYHEIRCRVKLLQRGAAPNPRRPKYIANDRNIALAKETLQLWLDTVHAEALTNPPPDVLLEEHEATTAANLLLRLLRHLDHVQHFIGL